MAKAGILTETEHQRQAFRHGGREVLRISATLPCGDSLAARHVRALYKALCEFAERELLVRAASELECCAGEGRGYAFVAYSLQISFKITPVKRRFLLELAATYARGREVLFHRTLPMLWSADGEIQYKR